MLDSPTLDYIINALEKKGLDWWESPIEEFVPPELLENGKLTSETWEKGRDTMDVWFDSGTSWSMLEEMGVGRDRSSIGGSGGREFDADLCLEGSDQHRGWFQSQLLTAIGARAPGEEAVSPYASLITHGMVLDEKGKKMSKSLGNIISPMTILHGSSVCFLPFSYPLQGCSCRVRRTKNSWHMDPIFSVSGRLLSISGKTCR